MTKDVLISISGLQFAGGENSEPVEMITSGSYYKKNGIVILLISVQPLRIT